MKKMKIENEQMELMIDAIVSQAAKDERAVIRKLQKKHAITLGNVEGLSDVKKESALLQQAKVNPNLIRLKNDTETFFLSSMFAAMSDHTIDGAEVINRIRAETLMP